MMSQIIIMVLIVLFHSSKQQLSENAKEHALAYFTHFEAAISSHLATLEQIWSHTKCLDLLSGIGEHLSPETRHALSHEEKLEQNQLEQISEQFRAKLNTQPGWILHTLINETERQQDKDPGAKQIMLNTLQQLQSQMANSLFEWTKFFDIVRGDTKGLKNEGPFMAQWEPILDALKKPSKYGSRKELVELVQKRVDTDLLGPLSELLMIKRLVMAFEKYYEGKYGKEVNSFEDIHEMDALKYNLYLMTKIIASLKESFVKHNFHSILHFLSNRRIYGLIEYQFIQKLTGLVDYWRELLEENLKVPKTVPEKAGRKPAGDTGRDFPENHLKNIKE